MATTGNYEFTKNGQKFGPYYCHWDNYPTGARERLLAGLENGAIKQNFNIEKWAEENQAELGANCSSNYTYKVNLDTGMITIVKDCFEIMGSGGYNEDYVCFEVEYQHGFYSFLDSKTEENSVFEPKNVNAYKHARDLAVASYEARKKEEAEEKEAEKERVRQERIEKAKAMKAKEVEIEIERYTYGGSQENKTMKARIAKNKYIIITNREGKEIVFFVGESVQTGGYGKYKRFGEIKSITEKTVSTIGGGDYDSNCRIKIRSFVSDKY